MVSWRFLWSGIHQRPGRALLTLFSVAIGVATTLAVSVSISTTRQAFQEMYQTLSGRAALEVRTASGKDFDVRLLATIGETPGVKAAVPLLQRHTVLYFRSQRTRLILLGILPEKEQLVRDYVFEQGGAFPRGSEVLLAAELARSLEVQRGDNVALLTRSGRRDFRVSGLLAPKGAAAFQGGAVVFLPLDRAQRSFRATNRISTVSLVLEEGVPEEQVIRDLTGRLPPGFAVAPPATRTELARETLFSSEQGLNMAAALSLVAAAFIITNSLFMNLSERRRQLSTLRTIGATRGQVFGLVACEGLLLGLAGTLLGILAGIGGAALLTRVMESVFQTRLPYFLISPQPVLKAALLGPGLSLVAVLLPAWTATHVFPLEGMRPVPAEAAVGKGRWVTVLALVLMAGGALGSLALYREILAPSATPAIVAAALVGMSLLIPHFLAAVVWLLSRALEWTSSATAFLACRQILRQRNRSSLTAGVLFVAIVMSVGMGNSVLNSTQDVQKWVNRALIGDFVIRGTVMYDLTTGESPTLPDGVLAQVAAVPGVLTVEPWTFASTRSDGQLVMVVGRSFPAGAPLSLDLIQGEPEEVRQRLSAGEAVISTVIARRMEKHVGDTITLATESGSESLRIAGTCDDYIMGGTVIYVHEDIADQRLGLRGVNALLVRVRAEQRTEIAATLRGLCQQNGLLLHSIAELAQTINNLMAGVNAALWSMLVVGFVVAAFGLVNTLSMNVLEQTRELGLLRMVGMTRGQVGAYVLHQAAVIGLVGLVPGIAVGELVAYIINRVSEPVVGHPIDFSARPEVMVGCLVFGLLLSIAAACLPAARASRLLIGEAIQYE